MQNEPPCAQKKHKNQRMYRRGDKREDICTHGLSTKRRAYTKKTQGGLHPQKVKHEATVSKQKSEDKSPINPQFI